MHFGSPFFAVILLATDVVGLCMNHVRNDLVTTFTQPYGWIWSHDSSGEYSVDSNCTYLLQPVDSAGNAATSITIELLAGYVYEGTTTDDPLVATFGNHTLFDIVVPGSSALVNFQSDSTVNRDGFAAIYSMNGAQVDRSLLGCPFDCFGQGTCSNGICICDNGYYGAWCKNDDKLKVLGLSSKPAGHPAPLTMGNS
ncbi:hypothetical protein HKX48_000699 [Thoreauomyces humboldtii]|nr:hypothetical protein HKX48_000699 [Thoreauomyces humboldtii]